jgi:F-type H+-transporting ATPase subunit a
MAAEPHGSNPLNHVVDSNRLELPWGEYTIPPIHLGGVEFQITRLMLMELVVAALLVAILVPLARHIAKYPVTRGPFLNAFEVIVLYLRDGVARPAIGGHDADKYMPYLWTVFFFVLFSNLLGLVPGGASATGNINVTIILALMTFITVLSAGIRASGPIGFWKSLVPALDVPGYMKVPLTLLLFPIEVAGLLIRHVVLSVRLFANMLAGHLVLAVILGFIIQVTGLLWYVVTPASIFGLIAMDLLEIFIAFLQAYIFTLLSALFIGMAAHPH